MVARLENTRAVIDGLLEIMRDDMDLWLSQMDILNRFYCF